MIDAGQRSRWDARRAPGGWTASDAALAGVIGLLLVTEVVPNPEMIPHAPLVTLSLVVSWPLAWRRAYAGAVAVLVCLGHLGMSLVATGPFPPQLAVFPVLVALFTAASRTRGWASVAVGGTTLGLTVAAWLVSDEGHVDDFWPWLLWAGAWTAGTFVRRRSEVADHHAGRAALLEVEARTVAAESAQAERDRIARELHDVIAHSVSVMVVQAGAERLRLGSVEGPTAEALTAIEESGRSALAELRTMLGVLRAPQGEELAPLPGLPSVPALVARMRGAGLPVELSCNPADLLEDGLAATAAGTGLAAYRIVQEALTNVVRHAGTVPTRVLLEQQGSCLRVTVNNDAPAVPAAPAAGTGRGLAGMRERALALGGSFEAGERGGAFTVRAELPSGTVAS